MYYNLYMYNVHFHEIIEIFVKYVIVSEKATGLLTYTCTCTSYQNDNLQHGFSFPSNDLI